MSSSVDLCTSFCFICIESTMNYEKEETRHLIQQIAMPSLESMLSKCASCDYPEHNTLVLTTIHTPLSSYLIWWPFLNSSLMTHVGVTPNDSTDTNVVTVHQLSHQRPHYKHFTRLTSSYNIAAVCLLASIP